MPGRAKRDKDPLALASAEGPGVPVAEMLDEAAAGLQLELVAGQLGLDHRVHLARVQRPGLALTGYTDYIRYGRVQIVGSSEIGYLQKLTPRRRSAILSRLCRCRITCFVVTKSLTPPRELLTATEAAGIPLLTTPLESTGFIKLLSAFLEDRLATRLHLHGVLLDVFGVGALILGDSGIGKSECALDLIDRGHRLVADDVVEIKKMGDLLVGASPDLTRYHMELRGLGVLNIRDMYGVSSISLSKQIGLVIQLERWQEGQEYDRLGLADETFMILGLEKTLVRMPVAPGRNIALLVEVAARNQLLRKGGYDAARRFVEQVDAMVGSPPRKKPAKRPAKGTSSTRARALGQASRPKAGSGSAKGTSSTRARALDQGRRPRAGGGPRGKAAPRKRA
jgi:HPr kinase/phosphorylase